MNKTFSLKTIAAIALLFIIGNVANATNVVFNTVTGQAVNPKVVGSQTFAPLGSSGVQVNVDNGWNNNMVTSIGAVGSNFYAQPFIATVSSITRFGTVIREYSSEGQIQLAIAADNGGVPDYEHPLYIGSLINPTTTAMWYFETGINVPVTIGQKYYILLDGDNNAGATGNSGIGMSDTEPIGGGAFIYSNTSGIGTWDSYTGPLAIYVEGNNNSVPVSIWTIVLAFAVIGGGAFVGFRKKIVKQAI
jgi:hypothetical protein